MSIGCDNLTNIKGYSIATDLLVNDGIEPPKKRKNAKQWAPIFMPKQFVIENEDIETDKFSLSNSSLKKQGVVISSLRKQIREQALVMDGKSLLSIQEKEY